MITLISALSLIVVLIIMLVVINSVSNFLINRTEEWWKGRKIEKVAKKSINQLRQNLHNEFDEELKHSYLKGYKAGYSDKEKALTRKNTIEESI